MEELAKDASMTSETDFDERFTAGEERKREKVGLGVGECSEGVGQKKTPTRRAALLRSKLRLGSQLERVRT